jgi:hypothetical protein
VNSEELELSLRTEFENYLKATLARFRQEVFDIRVSIEAEFDKHKAQIDTALGDIETRLDTGVHFDRAFTESVLEHLRLARDEGAELAATAFGEAEKLKKSPVSGVSPAADHEQLRDAIDDISRQQTQTAILQTLVSHVSRFAPRGAFFIVKNDYFVGWRAFGAEGVDETSVREIFFPTSADTVMSAAAGSLRSEVSAFGGHTEDSRFLKPLGYGEPAKMVAVPLTARGRGVAVLYVDGGSDDASFALEAVESLVRVAGLTVELQASYAPRPQAATAPAEAQPATQAEEQVVEETAAVVEETQPEEKVTFEHVEEPVEISEPAGEEVEYQEYVGEVAVEEVPESVAEPAASNGYFDSAPAEEEAVDGGVTYFEPVAEAEPQQEASQFQFETNGSYGEVDVKAEPEPVVAAEPAFSGYETVTTGGNGFGSIPETVVAETPAQQPARTRGRNVQLPIEVSDTEKPIHTDAYTFARLLVSEIKMYNQQKVEEGRAARDLYDRLREAIDRSREMYEKRVKPEVATRFDYFDHMLVKNLADGDASKLGASYPGSAV